MADLVELYDRGGKGKVQDQVKRRGSLEQRNAGNIKEKENSIK